MTLQLLVLYMGVINMKKFEIGKEYFDRSACNHDCIFTIKIIKRTEKTVTFERNGKTRRAKLFFDERGELYHSRTLFYGPGLPC